MNKIIFVADWLSHNHRPIGYTVSALNTAAGLNFLFHSQAGLAIIWLLIGTNIAYNTWLHK
jgi:hypothetical protein